MITWELMGKRREKKKEGNVTICRGRPTIKISLTCFSVGKAPHVLHWKMNRIAEKSVFEVVCSRGKTLLSQGKSHYWTVINR